jgi:hypothetical protein
MKRTYGIREWHGGGPSIRAATDRLKTEHGRFQTPTHNKAPHRNRVRRFTMPGAGLEPAWL